VQQFQELATANMKELFRSLLTIERNEHAHLNKSGAIAQSFMQQLLLDTDLVMARHAVPAENEYLLRHSLQTSVLSMALAAESGYDDRSVVIVGMAGLLHDVGMQRVSPTIREAPRDLHPTEFLEVTRHVIYSTEIVERGRSVPQSLLLAVYQAHERSDGSGYPRGAKGNSIHLFARMIAIADTYLAMISPRPYRSALHPYTAIETIVRHAAKGLFDPNTVRAFLRVLSLYPIGSDVILSDGRAGRVLRSNRVDYDRPVVEILLDADGRPVSPTEIVDLADHADLRVQQATRLAGAAAT
jgi:HD-GYP domain-containing protein (c-di-GMP phosphodiesterase class II)